ncbi:protein kinase [Solirubrobacter ginsenosidimutans]|uniref:non-specific serine/threonine protein kinase n=1 Tax=Solirubrobacter ginsenosidimutans TaxID=490573 RepID=A0A9X3S715_9ACTN|nr:protein kinase [Solirubrobacter ginsenosidimutans]MDA0165631.1 protein kinase [Solirubrobacter ginsenosidimutans]
MATEQLFADRYRLERRLGVGGMATVQLAFDTRLERNVAVKLLAEHLAEDSSFVSRFRREALAAARLVHPNIVQVFDFGTDVHSGRQFIVMEYVDGHSCAELLRDNGPMSPRDAVEILTQACRGLDYAHRNGVVHRDVKPGNLMVNTDGVVKLADFGIAKAAEQSDITKVGSVLGTAAYLSPEQARGEPAGPASDMYALGVVSYQLMAGRLPYEAASLTDLARLQESAPPPRLSDEVRDVPPALAAAVARALARDPARRYEDAAEMEDALRDGLAGIGYTEGLDSTRALPEEDATRMLPPTGTVPRARRPLQPVIEDPPPPRRAAPSRRQAPPPKKQSGGAGKWVALVLVIVIVVAGAIGYQALNNSGSKQVQLNEKVGGSVDDAVQSFKDLIDNNTR